MLTRLFPLLALASATAIGFASACSGSEDSPSSGGAGLAGTHPGGSSANAGGDSGAHSPLDGGMGGATAGANPSENGGQTSATGGAVLGGAGGGAGDTGGAGGATACDIQVAEQPLAAGIHVTACSDVTYATNPPSSGPHYPVWADYGVYDFALPRGFWVHNLEHGSVVVTYHCPDGCADEVAAAATWLAGLEPDPSCPSGPARVLLLPDPLLDVRWAASSWGYTLRADCFDAAAFTSFYTAHAGKSPAPEALVCSAGADFRDPANDACGVNQSQGP